LLIEKIVNAWRIKLSGRLDELEAKCFIGTPTFAFLLSADRDVRLIGEMRKRQ